MNEYEWKNPWIATHADCSRRYKWLMRKINISRPLTRTLPTLGCHQYLFLLVSSVLCFLCVQCRCTVEPDHSKERMEHSLAAQFMIASRSIIIITLCSSIDLQFRVWLSVVRDCVLYVLACCACVGRWWRQRFRVYVHLLLSMSPVLVGSFVKR